MESLGQGPIIICWHRPKTSDPPSARVSRRFWLNRSLQIRAEESVIQSTMLHCFSIQALLNRTKSAPQSYKFASNGVIFTSTFLPSPNMAFQKVVWKPLVQNTLYFRGDLHRTKVVRGARNRPYISRLHWVGGFVLGMLTPSPGILPMYGVPTTNRQITKKAVKQSNIAQLSFPFITNQLLE